MNYDSLNQWFQIKRPLPMAQRIMGDDLLDAQKILPVILEFSIVEKPDDCLLKGGGEDFFVEMTVFLQPMNLWHL